MGFEFELLENLAEYLDVELNIVVAKSFLDLGLILAEGKADLIAHGLTITERRKEFVAFTDYLFLTKQVLVQRKPENWRKMKLHEIEQELIRDNVELLDQTVSVRANSSYFYRLDNLMEELGGRIYIDTMPDEYDTERLIEMVVDGKIKYTVADDYIASINASYFPELDVKVPMSFSQRIAWAVGKESPKLLGAINNWLKSLKGKPDFNVMYERYFEDKKDFRRRLSDEYFSVESGKISKYDDLIKRYADSIGWDWRLLSAMVYQESQFDPSAKSWAGAYGLMQLMPATAKEWGVTNRANPGQNIKGATSFLNYLWGRWDSIPDPVQRTKFTMASYNCGLYHVQDAVRLAAKNGSDVKKWDGNVESYMLLLAEPAYFNDPDVHYGYVRGLEPVTYVLEIFERYDHYKKFVSK
jgi:membrane-bound lytic murein transglycosylase F